MTRSKITSFIGGALFALATLMLAVGPAMTVPVHAQATVNSTTTALAVTATALSVRLTSTSTVTVGQLIYIDRELMSVNAVSSPNVTVTRGVNGTRAYAHAAGAVVFTGPPDYFSGAEPVGPCVAINEVALPRIVAIPGHLYQCSDSAWVKYTAGGFQQFSAGASTTYILAGAITVKPGLTLIGSAGALSMTLAACTGSQQGMTMAIFASTAQAHTVTNTAGFNGGTTARDLATYGGSIGDGMVVQCWGLTWYVLANRNVTLG